MRTHACMPSISDPYQTKPKMMSQKPSATILQKAFGKSGNLRNARQSEPSLSRVWTKRTAPLLRRPMLNHRPPRCAHISWCTATTLTAGLQYPRTRYDSDQRKPLGVRNSIDHVTKTLQDFDITFWTAIASFMNDLAKLTKSSIYVKDQL